MNPLGPPDTHHLSAAIGWMELGNCTEALVELAKVAPTLSAHPHVLEVRWAIYAAAKNWAEALEAANLLLQSDSSRVVGWLHRAYALRRAPGGSIKSAWDALLPAVDRFPTEATIPYNLACYAAQMGQLDEARRWLRRAVVVGEGTTIKRMALADSDLEPLWKEVKDL
jgi:tetratricopeptide (TPR) repeat protein